MSTEEDIFENEKSIIYGLIVVGGNLEAPAIIAILDEQITKEGENREAPNELANDKVNTEKVDEGEKVPKIDISIADTE